MKDKCYYVHCPMPCQEQRRGHKCPTPWKRKNYTVPLTSFIPVGERGHGSDDTMLKKAIE